MGVMMRLPQHQWDSIFDIAYMAMIALGVFGFLWLIGASPWWGVPFLIAEGVSWFFGEKS